MRKTIAVDMDQVLADLLTDWIDRINKFEDENISYEHITTRHISKIFKCGDNVYKYLDYDLYRNLAVIKDSQRIIKKLMNKYDIYVVTSATSYKESVIAKLEWLEEHFNFIPKENIVLCGNKSIIKSDYMIDDGVHNLESFDGTGILFDAPYNKDENRFVRVNNWNEIGKLLL